MEDRLFALKPDREWQKKGDDSYFVSGLPQIFYHDLKHPTSGAVALLRSRKYPGYCRLFFSYCNAYLNGAIEYSYVPAFTKEGYAIYIQTNHQTRYAIFDEGVLNTIGNTDDERTFGHEDGRLTIMDDSIYDDSNWFQP